MIFIQDLYTNSILMIILFQINEFMIFLDLFLYFDYFQYKIHPILRHLDTSKIAHIVSLIMA